MKFKNKKEADVYCKRINADSIKLSEKLYRERWMFKKFMVKIGFPNRNYRSKLVQ